MQYNAVWWYWIRQARHYAPAFQTKNKMLDVHWKIKPKTKKERKKLHISYASKFEVNTVIKNELVPAVRNWNVLLWRRAYRGICAGTAMKRPRCVYTSRPRGIICKVGSTSWQAICSPDRCKLGPRDVFGPRFVGTSTAVLQVETPHTTVSVTLNKASWVLQPARGDQGGST